ncbi:MAG: shikimate kinase, partial [Desulfosarcinaceae bacterium]
GFRAREKALMQRLAAADRQVVGTGGGVVLDEDNVAAMRASGKVVWLRSRPETIRRYIEDDHRSRDLRPALTDKGLLAEIEDTLNTREPIYRAAMDVAVNTDVFNVDALCKVMIEKLQKIGLPG